MSSGMYGADVAQLRDLARRLQSASDQLNGSRQRIGSGIRIAAWVGPVAVRFRMLWDSEYSRQVQGASDALERISRDVLKQAEQQERASARDGGAAGSRGGGNVSVADLVRQGGKALERTREAVLALIAAGATTLDVLRNLQDLEKVMIAGDKVLESRFLASPALGKVLLPLGALLSARAVSEAAGKGDVLGAFVEGGAGIASTGVGIAGASAPAAAAAGWGVIGLGVIALKGLVDVSIPYTAQAQDAAMAQGIRDRFPNADRANRTQEQSDYIARRYDSPLGPMAMISDTMRASGEPLRKALVSVLPITTNSALAGREAITRVLHP
ncbi:WXG100 family type VII secretion target [Rathayibacter festucae]|nr:WXG100 family type VII secretion target [Rathayibacter festucae]